MRKQNIVKKLGSEKFNKFAGLFNSIIEKVRDDKIYAETVAQKEEEDPTPNLVEGIFYIDK